MKLVFFVTNSYQLAITRALISLYSPRHATIVYCSEFINENNPFLRYLGNLEMTEFLSVSENFHRLNSCQLPFKSPERLVRQVYEVVQQSDMVFFGDPYLFSQRQYILPTKSNALIEDSPTLFSYFRYRDELPGIKRWLGEFMKLHPVFDTAATCFGFSARNNCPQGRYVNLLKILDDYRISSIKEEIRREFQFEFENLQRMSNLNGKNTILLLTQPLASDGIVGTLDEQVHFYLKNIKQLQTAGFRVVCKLHPRDVANSVHYPIEPDQIFHFSPPMELFEDELCNSFVGIASLTSSAFAESNRFIRITLSL
jgi:hypothetical protein